MEIHTGQKPQTEVSSGVEEAITLEVVAGQLPSNEWQRAVCAAHLNSSAMAETILAMAQECQPQKSDGDMVRLRVDCPGRAVLGRCAVRVAQVDADYRPIA